MLHLSASKCIPVEMKSLDSKSHCNSSPVKPSGDSSVIPFMEATHTPNCCLCTLRTVTESTSPALTLFILHRKPNEPRSPPFSSCASMTPLPRPSCILTFHYTTFGKRKRVWEPRKQGKLVDRQPNLNYSPTLGRIYTVSSKQKCFYLRLLLREVMGPTSFDNLKTFNDETFPTYC